MTKFTDIVQKYNARMMKDFEITETQACGIWGNLGAETGGFVHLQELKPLVQNSKGGYGWMQWTGPRRKKYEAWCKAQNLLPADDETNYRYLVHETLHDEWKSIQQVRKTTTLKAATETFMLLNLRPGVRHLESRVKWAEKAQDALKTKTATQVAAPAAATAGVLIGSAALYSYWETALNHWPWLVGIGAAMAIAGIIYLIRKNNV